MTRTVRVLLLVLAVIAAVALLFTVVFPWVDRTFVADPVLDGSAAALLGT